MAQSGSERLVELSFLVRNPIAAAAFDEYLSGGIKGEVHSVPGGNIPVDCPGTL